MAASEAAPGEAGLVRDILSEAGVVAVKDRTILRDILRVEKNMAVILEAVMRIIRKDLAAALITGTPLMAALRLGAVPMSPKDLLDSTMTQATVLMQIQRPPPITVQQGIAQDRMIAISAEVRLRTRVARTGSPHLMHLRHMNLQVPPLTIAGHSNLSKDIMAAAKRLMQAASKNIIRRLIMATILLRTEIHHEIRQLIIIQLLRHLRTIIKEIHLPHFLAAAVTKRLLNMRPQDIPFKVQRPTIQLRDRQLTIQDLLMRRRRPRMSIIIRPQPILTMRRPPDIIL